MRAGNKHRQLTRRRFLQRASAAATAASAYLLATACGSGEASGGDAAPASATKNGTSPTTGGTARIALTGDPPNLDIHQTTDSMVLLICAHAYETLFTWDAGYRPAPLLAETHQVLDGGFRHRVVLRENVSFHNGEILTAADVIASVDRWSTISGLGQDLMASVDEIVEVDRLTLDFEMHRQYGAFQTALSRQLQGCAIYPRSVLERSTRTKLAEYVGTGPYEIIEWLPDRYVQLARFSDYRRADEKRDGYAGSKAAHLDSIRFLSVRNEASRIAGMQAGDYHYVETISPDQAPVLRDASGLRVDTLPADSWLNIVLNLRSPIFASTDVRRALQVAIDHEQIMLAAVGEGFYEITPELLPGASAWYSESGSEFFNRNDPGRAATLLEQSGYDGSPLRMMVTQEVQHEYNATLTMKQQLERAGFNVDLQVFDGATLSDRRNDESLWETYTASASFRPDPVMRNITKSATGWWENSEKEELLLQLQTESDFERRFEIWERIQLLFYEDVPRLKIGNIKRLLARSSLLRDIGPSEMQPEFSNAWLDN